MNEIKLSQRLQAVADEIPEGKKIADIGSDHAYLPCSLCLNGRVTKAVAGEVADGPFESALTKVKENELEHVISVRKGDGLAVISAAEVDVIVIAGMGGKLMADILERGKSKLQGVQRLVLQPNVAEQEVRSWLMKNNWDLKKETILEEDHRIYEVLVAEPGNGKTVYHKTGEAGLRYGPYLMCKRTPIFRRKWQAEIAKWKRIEAQLDEAVQTESIQKQKKLLGKKISETEEMLNG